MRHFRVPALGLLVIAFALVGQEHGTWATNWCSGGVCQEWVVRYDGPASGDDSAAAMTIDASDNVYVTGSSEGSGTGLDYATIKYNSDGSQLWVARYDGPASGNDQATDVAVDPAGNVYVTGSSAGVGTGLDYATVKYDADGNELWVRRYNGLVDGDDEAKSLALDSLGNVHITGNSPKSTTGYNRIGCATIKYSASGQELWVRRLDINSCYAEALAIDNAGNTYVTGEFIDTTSTSTYNEGALFKYDASGSLKWTNHIQLDTLRRGYDIALDDSGNVYVTGYGGGGCPWLKIATVSYDSAGTKLWGRIKSPQECIRGAAGQSVVVGAGGDTYVAGYLGYSATNADYATIKYESGGAEAWHETYSSPASDRAEAIGLDDNGNSYVTGRVYGSGYDYGTISYDTDGGQIWAAFYNGPPGNADDEADDLAVDDVGIVYVTGSSEGSGTGYDYATVKYAPDPDGDAIPNASDNCPDVYNPGQENDVHAGTPDGDHCEDPDGDLVPDVSDVCPDDADNDGDGDGVCNGSAFQPPKTGGMDNCASMANTGQENADGDQWGDACDNCPLTSTPWFVPAGDGDCDGFSNTQEAFVGTDPADACPDDPSDDAWPADLADLFGYGAGHHDGVTNIFDINELTPPYFNKCDPDPLYTVRKDFSGLTEGVPDGCVNIFDIALLTPPMFGKSCTP